MSEVEKDTGWHFVGDTLRDGRPVPTNGVWLEHKGELAMCESGLHYSRHPFDALRYAPGNTLCKVQVRGAIYEGDKGVAQARMITNRFDATDLLQTFARQCALDVIHLWGAPDVVRQYLETGGESLRDAARAAVGAAVKNVADAAEAAAWSAAEAAARAAEWAARDARAAARAAARAVSEDAAWAVSEDAQRQRFFEMVKSNHE